MAFANTAASLDQLCPGEKNFVGGCNLVAVELSPAVGADRRSPGYRSVVIRRLFTLALFLLLGAVVNVAVAWAGRN